nr:histidine kinase [Corynebacterium lipophilum]
MEQWDNDIRARRTSLARALHDSVAASLTSVVMRAETLSLQQGFAAEIQVELAAIAEQARDSMKEVRGLLRILSSDSSSCSSDLEPSAADQFHQIVSFLKAHGFTVETRGSFRALSLNPNGLVVLREVLKEVATNIIKYANPGSTVTLTVEDHDGYVTISFINTVGSRKPASDLTTGLGLPAISQLAEGIGGDMRTVSSSTRWNTELRIPQQKQ